MAKGRMVNKKICTSKRVNDLPVGAALLYTWLISHLDCNGVFYGDAKMVKSLVFPRQVFTEKQVEKWLEMMEQSQNIDGVPLIYRYYINSERLLWMPGFDGEQVGLRKDKEHPEHKLPSDSDEKYKEYTESLRKYYGKKTTINDGNITEVRPTNRIEGNMNRKEVEGNKENLTENLQQPLNEKIGELVTLYENNIGMITPIVVDKIKIVAEEYSYEWIKTAIEKAVTSEKRSWSYVEGVLKGFKRDGFNNGNNGGNHNKINSFPNHTEIIKPRYKYVN